MMKMEPPVIYLPQETIAPVQEILKNFVRLDRGRMPCDLRPLVPGDEIELSRELVVTVSATKQFIKTVSGRGRKKRRFPIPFRGR